MSFGAVADDYDRVRPGPPAEAIDWLLPDRCDVVVDLAAGTGLLTRALAGKARRVIAVEPDGRMRAVLQSRSGEVEALAGRGEAIPLPADSADAVLVSSAWHWMNPDLAVPEIARVLRPGGRLGMLWTGRAADIGWLHADDWFSDARAEQEAAAAGRAGASPRGHEELWYPQAGSPAAGEAEPVPRIPDREARQVRLPQLVALRQYRNARVPVQPVYGSAIHRGHAGHLQRGHHGQPGSTGSRARAGGGRAGRRIPRRRRARGSDALALLAG